MPQRTRISQREGDGAILGWTLNLHKNKDWRSGWLEMKDGEQIITLDTPEPLQMDNRTQSEIERLLHEENDQLKKMLYRMGWDGNMGSASPPDVVAAPQAPVLATGETALAPVQTPVIDYTEVGVPAEITLLPADPVIETPLPTPPTESTLPPVIVSGHLSKSKLKQMRKELLIVHAHSIKPSIDLPDDADRKKLVEICLDLQKEHSE